VVQQPLVVDGQKALQRVWRPFDAGGLQRADDERGGSVANHSSDVFLGDRRGAVRHQELVGGVCDVAPRIDQRAIQVEDE